MHSDDLEERLSDAVENASISTRTRKELKKYLDQLQGGVIPPLRRIYAIFMQINEEAVCVHLNRDGSCLWLTANAKVGGVRKPKPGETLYCKRGSSQNVKYSLESCPGYQTKRV